MTEKSYLITRLEKRMATNGRPLVDMYVANSGYRYPVLSADAAMLLTVGIDPDNIPEHVLIRAYYKESDRLNSKGNPYKNVTRLEDATAQPQPTAVGDVGQRLAKMEALLRAICTKFDIDPETVGAPAQPAPNTAVSPAPPPAKTAVSPQAQPEPDTKQRRAHRQPAKTAVSPPPQATAVAEGDDDFMFTDKSKALDAIDMSRFCKAVCSALQEEMDVYKTADNVKSIVYMLNPRWLPNGQNGAMFAALETYAHHRRSMEKRGESRIDCHHQSLGAARRALRKFKQ